MARLWTSWWFRLAIFTAITALALAVVVALLAPDQQLQRRANQTQVVGLVVTVVGLAISVLQWIRDRSSPQSGERDTLAWRVWKAEERNRSALLGGTEAASLVFRDRESVSTTKSFRSWLTEMVTFRDAAGRGGDLRSIAQFFSTVPGHRLVITGEAGAGKTVIAIQLILDTLRPNLNETTEGAVPTLVRIDAATWRTGVSLEQWWTDELSMQYGMDPSSAARLVGRRQIIPVLDGLDEIDPDRSGSFHRAAALIKALNDYRHGTERGPVIVICRSDRYLQLEKLGLTLRDARHITIQPLTVQRLDGYVRGRLQGRHDLLTQWASVVRRLLDGKETALHAVLNTPWRAFLAVTATEAGLPPTELLRQKSESEADARARVNSLLLERYVPSAVALAPDNMPPARVEAWLRTCALHLAAGSPALSLGYRQLYRSPHELMPYMLWPIAGRRLVPLLHIAIISVGLAMSAVAAVMAMKAGTPEFAMDRQTKIITVALPAFALCFAASVAMQRLLMLDLRAAEHIVFEARDRMMGRDTSRTAADVRYRFDQPTKSGFLAQLGFLSAVQVTTVGISGQALGWIALPYAAVTLLLIAIQMNSILIGRTAWRNDSTYTRPRSAVRAEMLSALLFGPAFTFGSAVIFCAFYGLRSGLVLGAAFGILGTICGVLLFGRVFTRYAIAATVGALRGRMPFRVGKFFEWARIAGLMRASGLAYQFRHVELQEWLATSPLDGNAPDSMTVRRDASRAARR